MYTRYQKNRSQKISGFLLGWQPRIALMLALCSGLGLSATAALTTGALRCEYLTDPKGIDVVQPRLSWVVESNRRSERQTAYQVLVASTSAILKKNSGDLWDSGKVAGAATSQVVYRGSPLTSRMQCFWKVRSWDRDGNPSEWSAPAAWTVGLLEASEWSAKWIDAKVKLPPSARGPLPVINRAVYETVDESAALDVTELLTKQAAEGDFSLDVQNESFGEDPAYGKVKRLRVEYTLSGKKSVRFFNEKSTLSFPGDLCGMPVISRAVYEAVDGSGSLDVTEKLAEMAESGNFSLLVDNESIGPDPSFRHLKQLRIEYKSNGKTWEKIVGENKVFYYPSYWEAPEGVPYLRKTFTVGKPVVRATVYVTALGLY